MKLDEIEDKDTLQYPEPLTIRISTETKMKIEALKKRNKKTAPLLRSFIESGLKKIENLETEAS